MVSLGTDCAGVTLPHVDPSDVTTLRAGAQTRFARDPPTPNAPKLARLRVFVENWLSSNLTRLPRDTDVSFETWVANTNYPDWRKKELADAWYRYQSTGWKSKYGKVKSFVKDEQYSEYKHARWINSRSDEYKCITGPYYKAIETVLYRRPEFIKHVPVKDRPEYIRQMLERENVRYVATDYTAFESLFTREVMSAVEFQLYEYMWRDVVGGRWMFDLVRRVQGGRNTCDNKYMTVKVNAKRMSGEMCTSLGNGFANLMLMLFVAHEAGATNVIGCVEGDDGLFSMEGNVPSARDFEDVGMIIKLEVHRSINTASFCGMIFDTEDQIIITDVMAQLARFGWTKSQYTGARGVVLQRLLHSKSLSMLYSYAGCPVLHKLARYGLRATRNVQNHKLQADTWWQREQNKVIMQGNFDEVYAKEPTLRSRLLVEEKYGLTVRDQLLIEGYLDSLTEIQPLRHPAIEGNLRDSWVHYGASYVYPMPVHEDLRLDIWNKMTGFDPGFA